MVFYRGDIKLSHYISHAFSSLLEYGEYDKYTSNLNYNMIYCSFVFDDKFIML